jgi:hypothetical protein
MFSVFAFIKDHILGTWPDGRRGRNTTEIYRTTGCKVHVEGESNPSLMCILIKRNNIGGDLPKAIDQVYNLLAKFLLDPQSTDRLYQQLATSTVQKYEQDHAPVTHQPETIDQSFSATSSNGMFRGTTRSWDEQSQNERPKKMPKKETHKNHDAMGYL